MDLTARRKSQAVAPLMGLIAAKRLSRHWAARAGGDRSSSVSGAPVVKLENTYRLEPKSKFDMKVAQKIVQEQLDEHVEGKVYSQRGAVMLSKMLTDSIKNRLKNEMNFERYRLVVHLTIGERKEQALMVSSRCVWNDHLDTSVTASCSNKSMSCIVTVFAVSLE